jgi:hypothetical protein
VIEEPLAHSWKISKDRYDGFLSNREKNSVYQNLRIRTTSNKQQILFSMIIIGSAVSIVLSLSYYLYIMQETFNPREIYPTKQGGREWHVNMDNPLEDDIFDPGTRIIKLQDGSWAVGDQGDKNYQVRMNVLTPPGLKEWKNVEITGYVKVIHSASEDSPLQEGAINWYARGGRHSDSVPCDGTSLKGILSVNGVTAWQKEIWHTGGYTNPRSVVNATNPIMDRWIGWKVVMYNINNDTAVKMESYLDDNANNDWKKVSELIDKGGWYSGYPDDVFYSVDCNRPKDYVVTNSGPIVTFRSDKIMWQFKDLSVREITVS